MVVLLLKLVPHMQPSGQEFSLNNVCRLCSNNPRNIIKSCQSSILFDLIDLLNHNKSISSVSLINKLFRTIQILGRHSITSLELKEFISLLAPAKQFPHGLSVLRCLLAWSKQTASIGFNYNQLGQPQNNAAAVGIETDSSSPTKIAKDGMSSINGSSSSSRLRRTSLISLNQTALTQMLRSTGTGALSSNSFHQAKHFFDFQHGNSGIRAPSVKKWPGYAFTFHAWVKLRSDSLALYEKKRRQLYSFYADSGLGFEAFFTADGSSLVVSVCTKKECLSVQVRELNFDSSNQQSGSR